MLLHFRLRKSACRADSEIKNAGVYRQHLSAVVPFQVPTRLADGLEAESPLYGESRNSPLLTGSPVSVPRNGSRLIFQPLYSECHSCQVFPGVLALRHIGRRET